MNQLIEIFMNRDDLSQSEATVLLNEMRDRVSEGEDPEEVLYDEGLEPDYLFDLI